MADAARKLNLAKPGRTRHEITTKQGLAIRELLAGKTDEQAAKAASVSRSTVNQWKHNDPIFMAELANRSAEIWNDYRNSIRELTQAAIAEVGRAVKAQDTRTAIWVLENCGGFDEIAKEEFANLKARPASVDDVLRQFATLETEHKMESIMKRPPDSVSEFGSLEEFIRPSTETSEQIRYRTLRSNVFEDVLGELRDRYGVDDNGEDIAEE